MRLKMKSVVAITAALASAAVVTSAASAGSPGQPAPIPTPVGVAQNPWPGKKFDVFFYVETVTANKGESVWGKAAPLGCTQTNYFVRGERAVWHITAVNTRTGNIITNADAKYAYLKVPGMENIGVTFTPHGRDPVTAPWTWTARWDIPLDYPLGLVPFQLVMKLKEWKGNKVATFTQMPLAAEQMTIVDKRTT